MPSVMRSGPYRLFFYASDRDEPRHIHVERADRIAKYWLNPVRLQSSVRFNRLELSRIRGIIEDNHEQLLEAWNGYFGD